MSTTAAPTAFQQDHYVFFVHELFIVRCVTISVYIVLLLEHLASMPQEIEFIWKAPWNLARICFLLYRYSTIVGLTILMHVMEGLSGPLNVNFCKHAVASLVALSVFSMGIADALVMLRVSVLWGRQRVILAILFLAFFASYSTAIVCAVIAATKLVSHTVVLPIINMCAPLTKPYAVLGVWVPGMVFDGLVLSMTSWNACAQPRNQETALAQALYRDGIAFFLILAGLRAVNLLMTIFSPLFLVGVCISWPLSAITLSRFIFHLRRLERIQQANDSSDDLDFTDADADSELPHALETSSPYNQLPHGSLVQLPIWESLATQSHCGASTVIGSEHCGVGSVR